MAMFPRICSENKMFRYFPVDPSLDLFDRCIKRGSREDGAVMTYSSHFNTKLLSIQKGQCAGHSPGSVFFIRQL